MNVAAVCTNTVKPGSCTQVHGMLKQRIRCKFVCSHSSVPEGMKPQH